jgi:hypothetical protein
MGGNHSHGNNDPFAKTKFTMIPFAGTADPDVRPGHTVLCIWCTFPRIWDEIWPTPYICCNYS